MDMLKAIIAVGGGRGCNDASPGRFAYRAARAAGAVSSGLAGAAAVTLAVAVVLPDAKLTPGAVATSDPAIICQPGYSQSQRLHDHDRAAYDALRRAAFARYGVAWEDRAAFELDDRIPLCLGGSQVLDNVWPEPRFGPDNAGAKDRVERAACRAACEAGTRSAVLRWQQFFRGDWRWPP